MKKIIFALLTSFFFTLNTFAITIPDDTTPKPDVVGPGGGGSGGGGGYYEKFDNGGGVAGYFSVKN